MLSKNIDTAKKVLSNEFDGESVKDATIEEAKAEAVKAMEDAEKCTKVDKEVVTITSKLEEVLSGQGTNAANVDIDPIEEELAKGSIRIKKCHKKWKKSTRGGGQQKTSKSPKFEIWTF